MPELPPPVTEAAPRHVVLVVDDDLLVACLTARMLENHGLKAHVAECAEGALRVLEREHCDLLLTDLQMPGHTGVWLANRVNRLHPHMAVITMSSAFRFDPDLRVGIWPQLAKPFDRFTLLREVEGALERAASTGPSSPRRHEPERRTSSGRGER